MYQEFAHVYDEFMEVISYTEWADYIEAVWNKHEIKPELVLDLACGTGGLAVELSKRGYDMIGADLSVDMLEEAREKAMEEEQDILFLQQDMREFELYGTVQSILCTCDSLNYLLELRDLEKVFALVDNYLDPNGVFVFDGVLISDRKLLNEFHALNAYGKKEAILRVAELKHIPGYTGNDDIPFK